MSVANVENCIWVLFIFSFPPVKKIKLVDCIKGHLRDNLKVFSFLFVVRSVVTSMWFFINSYSKTEFSCSLAAFSGGGGEDRRTSRNKMLN